MIIFEPCESNSFLLSHDDFTSLYDDFTSLYDDFTSLFCSI